MVFTLKALNRATLARQMLLAREKTTALKALGRLAALQAQLPRPPYVALWSRVAGFEAEHLTRLALERKAVRGTMMRGTLHLLSARDYLAWRPVLQPMLTAGMQAVLGERAGGLDVVALARTARECLQERPRTFEELRPMLKKAWPKGDERALGYAVRTHLPLVQMPVAGGRWGWPAAAAFSEAESWIGAPLARAPRPEALVLRYLGAFGPASVADAQAWTGMRTLEGTFAALRAKLSVFHDERGRELFDLQDAPRPPERTPAPVRFLPDFDTLLLGHADRTRVISDGDRPKVATRNLRILPTFLVDGFVRGTWAVERTRSQASLAVQPFTPLSRAERADVAGEGTGLLRFLEPDAPKMEVRFA